MGWLKDIRDTNRGLGNTQRDAWRLLEEAQRSGDPITADERRELARQEQSAKRARREAVLGQGHTRQQEHYERGDR